MVTVILLGQERQEEPQALWFMGLLGVAMVLISCHMSSAIFSLLDRNQSSTLLTSSNQHFYHYHNIAYNCRPSGFC